MMDSNNNYQGENIAQSLDKVLTILAMLEQSLKGAGFADNAAVYQRMSEVVIAQRHWTQSIGLPLHDAKFAQVAECARNVYALLNPYHTVAKRLATVSSADAAAAPASEQSREPPAQAAATMTSSPVLKALGNAPRPMSATALRESLKLSRDALQAELTQLIAQGSVSRVTGASRELYQLVR